MNRNTFFLALLSSLFFVASCKEKEGIEHRPRLTETQRQQENPEPIRLSGIFVDALSRAQNPDGKSWASAFLSIQDAIDASKGEQIIIAAGTYANPRLRIHDRKNIKLVGGYRAGELFEKSLANLGAEDMVILDGGGLNNPLLTIDGKSRDITILGGIIFKNVVGASAVKIVGIANEPVKNIIVYNCQFMTNRNASQKGAGIFIEHADTVHLTNVRAENNQAVHGGFLYARDVKKLALERMHLQENIALSGGKLSQGGSLYGERLSLFSLKNSLVRNSEAEKGAGIFLRESHQVLIEDVEFRDNKAPITRNHSFGAGLYVEDSEHLELNRFSMHNNTVKLVPGSIGGGLYILRSKKVRIDFTKMILTQNKAHAGGTIGILESDDIVIKGGKFDHNQAQIGGALYLDRNKTTSLSNMTLENNQAQSYGGAIGITTGKGKLTLESISFKANDVSAGNGGAFAVVDYKNFVISIKNCQFVDNKAQGNGGAALFRNTQGKVIFEGDSFKGNQAQSYGGALALDAKSNASAQFEIGAKVKFIQNRSEQKAGGGALFLALNNVYPPAVQLKILNQLGDYQNNSAGDGTLGTFLRVSTHDIVAIAPGAPAERGANPAVFGAYPLLDISRFISDTARFDYTEQQTIYLW